MTTSPSSGLSPEAKEFIPLVQNPAPSIPLYVDENTVASIYPSDQQPLMVQTIYPMMITTNSKVADNVPFPEIEFHIQPSQQQQFHIDACTNIPQSPSTNGNSSTNNTSQIVLLPTSNSATAVTPTGYYPGAQIIYSTNESLTGFYPMDYCEPPLINFSLQQPTHISKSNRMSSQQQRPNTFRQQHGSYRPSSRGGNRGNTNNNANRNPYYDYNNRRNCSSYTRGHSTNSKRISSSYHSHDYNNYYHSSPSRSRGYLSRSSHQQHNEHDEHRKDHSDYYNHEKDSYENDYQQINPMNDDETPFEFRLEDFPSLPMNNQQSDKTPSQTNLSATMKSASSWNEIVSAQRPRSTSPHSIPSVQDSRSDRSRSFNNKLSSNNERKPPMKKPTTLQTTKSPNRASKILSQDDAQHSPSLSNNTSIITENNNSNNENQEDGFIQTKQQHRRLKRRNKFREDPVPFAEQTESAPYALDDENAFPTLGQQTSVKKSENDSNRVTDMFNNLTLSTETSAITTDSKFHKPNKSKRKDLEENQKQENDSQNQTDTNTSNINEEEIQNSNPLSSISSNNSSDTSDYDDAVDNLDDE